VSPLGRRLLLAGLASTLALSALGARELSRVGVNQGYQPAQPIAFSHRLHAGDAQVPCLYCHFAATRSRHAGIPPSSVCMNCHALLANQTEELRKLKDAVEQKRPLAWTKVHNLPDFVYFNHSQHLAASLACQECHGPVEKMVEVAQVAPLTMGWCLDCHRRRRVGAPTTVAMAGHPQSDAPLGGLDCGKCHY
jgi:Class III cytochrome C family